MPPSALVCYDVAYSCYSAPQCTGLLRFSFQLQLTAKVSHLLCYCLWRWVFLTHFPRHGRTEQQPDSQNSVYLAATCCVWQYSVWSADRSQWRSTHLVKELLVKDGVEDGGGDEWGGHGVDDGRVVACTGYDQLLRAIEGPVMTPTCHKERHSAGWRGVSSKKKKFHISSPTQVTFRSKCRRKQASDWFLRSCFDLEDLKQTNSEEIQQRREGETERQSLLWSSPTPFMKSLLAAPVESLQLEFTTHMKCTKQHPLSVFSSAIPYLESHH